MECVPYGSRNAWPQMKNREKTMKALRPQKNQNESFEWLGFKSYILCVDPKMKRIWEIRWTWVKGTWWWIKLGGHTWSLAVWLSELGCQYWRNNLYKRNRRRGRGWHHTLGQCFHPLKHSLQRARWWRHRGGPDWARHTAWHRKQKR